jgi:competence protein ComEC
MLFSDLIPKRIFALIALGFCGGIIAHDWISSVFESFFIYSTILFTVWLFYSEKLKVWLGSLLLLVLFVAIGYQSIEQRLSPQSQQNFEEKYISEDIVFAEIIEISYSDKTWNKAIFNLYDVYRHGEKIPIHQKVLFLIENKIGELEKGDKLVLNSQMNPIENKGNPGEFDGKNYWKSKGISHIGFLRDGDFIVKGKEENRLFRWFNRLDRMLSELFEERLRPESMGIAKALILGDRDHLDGEAVRTFGNAGAMHVLAVSGLHVGLILSLLIFVLSRFPKWISKYRATIIALLIIWFYALITGFSPSVFRAVVMFSLLTIAKLSGKNYDSINVLMASAMILLLFDPLLFYDLGFQLSYLAMLGIFILYKPINSFLFFSNRWLKLIWDGTSVALAAQVFTLPLTLYFFHQYPNYFLLSNLGLMALTNFILIAGILLITIQFIPFISGILAWALSLLILAMFLFVQWIEALPASTATGFEMPFFEVVFIFGIIGIILFSIRQKGKWMLFGSVLIVLTSVALVYQRYTNLQKNEWVVFNEAHLTFCVKMDDEIHCFYLSDDHLQKSVYLAQSYQKIRPGNLIYSKLTDGKVELKKLNFHFTCSDSNSYYDIKINDKRWKLIKRIGFDNVSLLKEDCIYMPWIELEDEKGHFLNEGAFVAKL